MRIGGRYGKRGIVNSVWAKVRIVLFLRPPRALRG